jgi:hypothetical protein
MYDDDFDDEEWVDDVDDGESECLVCPSCRAEVHEDTQQCPHCGDWITPVYPERPLKGWVWKIAAILAILAMLLIILR